MAETRNLSHQICQDIQTDDDFKKLHKDIIDMIISFCKEHNLTIDEFYINGDCLSYSIDKGAWIPGTDSSFSVYKFDEEHPNMKSEPKPYLWSI